MNLETNFSGRFSVGCHSRIIIDCDERDSELGVKFFGPLVGRMSFEDHNCLQRVGGFAQDPVFGDKFSWALFGRMSLEDHNFL